MRAHETALRRGLTSTHVISIVVSSIIGTGIFIRSASMMQEVGSPLLLMAAWLLAGLLTLAGTLSYAELCTLMPQAGGEYVFLREAFGRPSAFLFGWMRFVLGAGMTAAIAVGVATFLTDALSLPTAWSHMSLPLLRFHLLLEWGPRQVIALGSIASLAVLNCRNVRSSGAIQSAFAGFKVTALMILIVSAALVSFSHTGMRPDASEATIIVPDVYGGFALAVLAALQAYNGWVLAAMLAGEVADSGRAFARNIVAGILIVIAFYVLINLAYVMLLSPSQIALSNSAAEPQALSVGAKLSRAVFGARAASIMTAMFAIAALGALHCNLLSIPRIFYAMARDGLFFPALGHIDQRSSVPRAAVACYSLWTAILAFIGGYDRLSNMAIFSFYLFYCGNVAALIVLRWRRPEAKRPFSVPGYPWIPLAFLFGSASMLVAIIIRGAPEVVWALALLALGVPAYWIFRRMYEGSAVMSHPVRL